ncbi:MAG: heavy-metal-associated domain-containing protein, partial [Natrinema limicola]
MSDASPPDAGEGPDASRTLELRVPEMDCSSCAGKVTNSVDRLEGIGELDARVTSGRLVDIAAYIILGAE